MINTLTETKIQVFLLFVAISSQYLSATVKPGITLEQIKKDVSILASDSMEGRGNFTPGIEKAANYIEKRFIKSGLKTGQKWIAGINGYRQNSSLITFSPLTASASINGKAIADENLSVVGRVETLCWSSDSDVTIQRVSKKHNLREILARLNRQGGKHLLLVSEKHREVFIRYRDFFSRGTRTGKNGFDENKRENALAMILTDNADLNDKTVITFKVDARFKTEGNSLSNVIGVLPGRSMADEIVIFSAHYDHLGISNAPLIDNKENLDIIYNGADDDASGTAAVINLAQYFAKKGNNERTLVFVAFAGEELGLFGSRYLSRQLDANKITAIINMELIGKPSDLGSGEVWMTGYDRSNLAEILNQNLSDSKTKIHPDPFPKWQLFYRSDNASFARLGVPAHSFSTTQIDRDKHYHKVSDEVETLDFESMTRAIRTLAKASESLVDGSSTPSRLKKSRIKPVNLIY